MNLIQALEEVREDIGLTDEGPAAGNGTPPVSEVRQNDAALQQFGEMVKGLNFN